MVRRLVAISALVLALAGCSSSQTATSSNPDNATTGCTGTIAVMASDGNNGESPSIMNWARIGLDTFNSEQHTSFSFASANVYGNPALAATEARQLANNPALVGVVGPATSSDTTGAGPVFDAAGLAYVSPSATAVALTDGRYPNFFRVVGDNATEATSINHLVTGRLPHHHVVVVGDTENYSRDLTARLMAGLDNGGVSVTKVVAPEERPDPAAVVAAVPGSDTTVILALLQPSDATTYVSALRAAGRTPAIVAGDALFDLSTFAVPGAYVANYAPDIGQTPEGRTITSVYAEIFGSLAPFAATSDVAMQAVATAALDSCHNGLATRAGVLATLPHLHLRDTVLGYPVSFTTTHDLVGARYWLYRIEGRTYQPVP